MSAQNPRPATGRENRENGSIMVITCAVLIFLFGMIALLQSLPSLSGAMDFMEAPRAAEADGLRDSAQVMLAAAAADVVTVPAGNEADADEKLVARLNDIDTLRIVTDAGTVGKVDVGFEFTTANTYLTVSGDGTVIVRTEDPVTFRMTLADGTKAVRRAELRLVIHP